MKSKVLKITNIILICCILIQTTSIIFINNKVYAESAENVINTVLGDIKVEVEGSGLKDGRVITITVSTTAENITSLGFYLEYDQSVFEKLDVKSDVEVLEGWGVTDCGETPAGEELFYHANSSTYACSNGQLTKIRLKVAKNSKESAIKLNYVNIINKNYEDNSIEDEELPSVEYKLYGINTYEITYESNANDNTITGIPAKEEKTHGEDYTISSSIPTRTGYNFVSWNTKPDGSGIDCYPNGTYNVDADLTLYAKWKEIIPDPTPTPDPKPEPTPEKLYLSSETYKIGNSDIKNYESGDKYISRITKETTLENYITNLKTNGTVKVLKKDGTELQNSEYIGTGMTLQITKDKEKIELQIAVMGDLNGDGRVTIVDLTTINHAILQTETLENEYKIAADINENDNISITDLISINEMILGIL